MSRSASPRLYVLLALVTAGLVGAVVTRRAELAALAAPGGAVLLLGAATHRWPELRFAVRPERPRVVEGDLLDLLVEVTTSRAVPWLDLEVVLPSSLEAADGSDRAVVALPAAGTRVVRFPVRAVRWGMCSPERLQVVARDRFGLFAQASVVTVHAPLRVHPVDAPPVGVVAPRRTGPTLGTHLSAERGEGCELADVRPYRPGDRFRSVNWRVTARRGQPWVNERHPERSTDLVLLLDAGTEVGVGEETTLRLAVRAAMALAEAHAAVHDRVGVCALGASVRWLPPRLGRAQLHRVVDTLLDSQVAAARLGGTGVAGALGRLGGSALPLRGLAPGTAVVALTPLLDPRAVGVVADLRRRGFDVVVLELVADALLPPPTTGAEQLARRLWRLEREAVRHQLEAVGVPCARWDEGQALGAVLDGLGRRRRGGRAPRSVAAGAARAAGVSRLSRLSRASRASAPAPSDPAVGGSGWPLSARCALAALAGYVVAGFTLAVPPPTPWALLVPAGAVLLGAGLRTGRAALVGSGPGAGRRGPGRGGRPWPATAARAAGWGSSSWPWPWPPSASWPGWPSTPGPAGDRSASPPRCATG